jgi:hypothetical protein
MVVILDLSFGECPTGKEGGDVNPSGFHITIVSVIRRARHEQREAIARGERTVKDFNRAEK